MDRTKIIKEIQKCEIVFPNSKIKVKIGNKIGQGGNGVVFNVHYKDKDYVIKIYIPPEIRELDATAYKRFQNEIELTNNFEHPYVITSIGTGFIDITTFHLPYYIMPKAIGTFRDLIDLKNDGSTILRKLKVFIRSCFGLSYIHNHGVVHRDIKPENILLFNNDVPAIADLGIAHINPKFIDDLRLTIPDDKLYNRDYYAPEQRYKDATKVDNRADIYAMGCILYELLSGIPATRPNLPKLIDIDKRLSGFDKIVSKMIEHEPKKRYNHIDFVFEDLLWAINKADFESSTYYSEEDDKVLLSKTIRSSNIATQEQSLDIAHRLGSKAIPVLLEQLGNRRIDVSRAAYKVLGELGQNEAIKYLVAGLYPRRNTKKLSFPTGDVAALALLNYPIDIRIKILDELNDIVLAEHIEIFTKDVNENVIFQKILKLYEKNLFYKDWVNQPGLSFLLKIDEEQAWPLVEKYFIAGKDIYTFNVFKDIYPFVNIERKKYILNYFLLKASNLSSWELPRILDALSSGKFDKIFMNESYDRLVKLASICIKRYEEREEFISKVKNIRK